MYIWCNFSGGTGKPDFDEREPGKRTKMKAIRETIMLVNHKWILETSTGFALIPRRKYLFWGIRYPVREVPHDRLKMF